MIAVIFAEPKGIYSKLENLEIWCKDKNALKYENNYPVIAHPPCQLWGRFAKINYARWGGEHNKPGNDGGCFKFALDAVNRCGGVLEHPAHSNAWKEYGLTKPVFGQWIKNTPIGWVTEVWQSAYGHKARKKTWLYYNGENDPLPLDWTKKEATHQIGFHDQRGKEKNKPTVSGKAASATPILFAKELLKLAKWSKK